MLPGFSVLLGEGAQGSGPALWMQPVTLHALRSSLSPRLPLATMPSQEPGPSLGSLPGTQSPTCVWIGLSLLFTLVGPPQGLESCL